MSDRSELFFIIYVWEDFSALIIDGVNTQAHIGSIVMHLPSI